MFVVLRALSRHVILGGLLAALLAACGQGGAVQPAQPTAVTEAPTSAPTREPTTMPTPGSASLSFDDFAAALSAAGATIKVTGPVEQEFFPVTGQVVNISGADVQVFEFDDEAAREAVSSQITPEGAPNATTMAQWMDQPNFWAKGRLIVLYLGTDAKVIGRLTSVLGTPITSASGGAATPGGGLVTNPASAGAIAALASKLGIAADQIEVVSFQPVEWSDSCLGLGQANEMCAQVITPGFVFVLRAGGTEYEVHTDSQGLAVRIK